MEWLVPISLFWPLAAVFVGGAEIRIEGGGGFRQLAGLLVGFTLFLVVWGVVRGLLTGALGAGLSVAVAAIVAAILLPLLARVGFRVLGVRITGAEA